MATTRDMNRLMIKLRPRGLSMRPSIPERKNNGTKATMMMKVALRMLERISQEASKTIWRDGNLSP